MVDVLHYLSLLTSVLSFNEEKQKKIIDTVNFLCPKISFLIGRLGKESPVSVDSKAITGFSNIAPFRESEKRS